jgi:hypothetical protein
MDFSRPSHKPAKAWSPQGKVPVAVPRMFDVLVQAVTRIAIETNNHISLPARGRLIKVLKLYHGTLTSANNFFTRNRSVAC